MILSTDLQKTLECLEGIVNQAAHPDIAVRVVMVSLKPIRKEITRLKLVMAHNSGADYPPDDVLPDQPPATSPLDSLHASDNISI